jgi:small GTP-binding protein
MQTKSDDPLVFKIILLGDEQTGKSQFLNRYAADVFSQAYQATIGVDVCAKTVKWQNKTIEIQIWDKASQEENKAITNSYDYNIGAIVYFADVTKALKDHDIKKYAKYAGKNVPVIIVVSKSDVSDEQKKFSAEELIEKLTYLDAKYDSIHIISAKTGEGMDTLGKTFESIAIKQTKHLTKDLMTIRSRIQQTLSKHPYACSILAGIILGAVLSATSLFTPFGAGVLGVVVLSVICGAMFGLVAAVIKSIHSVFNDTNVVTQSIESWYDKEPALTSKACALLNRKHNVPSQTRSFFPFARIYMKDEEIISNLKKLTPDNLSKLYQFCTAPYSPDDRFVMIPGFMDKPGQLKSTLTLMNILMQIDDSDPNQLKVVESSNPNKIMLGY